MSKKRYFLPILFYLICFFWFQINGVSLTISSAGSGSWSSTSTWAGGVIPTTADSVVINLGHTVGISSSATASALTVYGTLNIGQITIISGSVSGNGSITLSTSGVLNIGGNNIFSGSFSPGTGSVTYNGSGNQIVMPGNYYILNITGSGTKTISGNSTISNSFNVQSGAAFSLGGPLTNLGIAGTATIGGVFYYGNSILQKVTIGGNLSGAGNIDMTGGTLGHWLVLSGASNNIGMLTTVSSSGSRVIYNNAGGPQTIFPSGNYQILEINTSGAGIANLSGNTTVYDSLLIRPGATFAGSSVYNIDVKGTWRNDGTFNHGNGTVNFSGTAPQRIDGLVSTNFYNLNINTGAQVNVARSTIVSGSVNNSGNLNVNSSFNLTVLGNFNNNTPTCSFSYSDTVSISNGIYNSGMFTGSPNSTLKMVSLSPQSFNGSQPINTFNFFMDNIGNDLTLYTNLRVDGTLELHSDGNIILQGSDLILGPTATVISGPGSFGATRMIQTDGIGGTMGMLVKEGTAGNNFQMNYPIGDSTFFTPVNIAVSNVSLAGTGNISMKPVYYTSPSLARAKRFLQLSSSNITAVNDFQFMFTFGNSNADYVGVPSTVYRFVGGVPNNVTGASVNLPAYQYGITAPGNTFIDGEWHLELLSSPPTIASFSPNTGCPGDSIDVMGSGFLSMDSVVISSLHATFVIKSDTLLKVVIPSGASSSVIKVYNPFGSAASTGNLTVNPPATASAGTSQTACANNAAVILNASFGGSATGGVWSGGTGGYTPNNLTANATYSPSTGEITSGSVVLTWTATGGCGSPSGTVTITYTPAPTANAGADQTVCANNSTVNLNGSVTIATGGNWISSSSGTFSSSLTTTYNPTPAEISAGSVALILKTIGNGLCNPVSDTVLITIAPSPTVTAFGSPTTVCSGQSSNLTATASGGTSPFTYSWTPSTSLSSATVSNPIATPTANTTYYVNVTDAKGCINSTPAPVTINVNPTVTPTINISVSSGTNPTCSGTAIGFSSSITNGGTAPVYQWMVNGTNVGTNPTFNSSSFLNGDQVTCKLTSNATCASPLTVTSSPIAVTVNQTPSITSSASGLLCSGTAENYSITSSVSGSTYTWSRNNVAGISNSSVSGQTTNPIAETLTNTTTSPVNVVYQITPSASGCTGSTFSYTVTVNPTPTVTSSPTGTVCSGIAQNYSITSSISGTTFSWDRAAVANIVNSSVTGQASNPILESLINTSSSPVNVTYVITPTANGCNGTATNYVVMVNPIPAAPTVTSPVNYCQNATASQLTATGSGLLWYTASSGGTGNATAPTPSTVTLGTTSNYVSQTVGGCESSRSQIDVVINAVPAAPTVSSPVNYCQNATASQLIATGSGLLWYSVSSGGTGNATAPIPSTATVGTTSNYVSQTVSGCESSRSQIDVVINAVPAAPTVTSPVTYCQNATASQLTATGSGLLWYTAASGGTGNATAPTPSTSTVGTTSNYVSQTVSGCESSRAQINVVINASPVVTSPATGNICSGVAQNYSITSNIIGTTYSWSRNAVAGISNGTVTGQTVNPITETLTNTSGSSVNAIYLIIPSAPNGCTGSTFNYAVTVNSLPSISISVNPTVDTLCNGIDGNISLLTSETGVTYTAFKGSTSVSSSVMGNGGTISLAIPNSSLSNGSNDIQIKATNSCGVDTLVNSSIIKKSSITAPGISASGVSQLCSAGNSTVTLAISNSFPKIQWYLGNSLIVGDTNSTYKVVTPGDYHVIVKDSLCSISSSSFTVTSSVAVPVVTLSNGSSYTSATCSGSGSYYQWYANGKAIYGANLSSYNIYYNAQYFVALNQNGCRVVSLPVNIQNPTYDSLAKKNFLSNDSIIYIEAPLEGDEALVYPNPAKDAFKVLYNAQNESEIVVSIYSGEGEKISDKTFAKQAGVVEIDFAGLNLSPGLYKLLILEGNRKVIRSIQLVN